jgi:hypothetical protein
MKAKSKVAKVKVEAQLSTLKEEVVKVNQFISEFPQTIEELRQLKESLGDVLSCMVLVSEMLIQHGDENLELKNESGERVLYSSVGMASGEVLEIYATKLNAAYDALDGITSGISRRVDSLVPDKTRAASQTVA